MMKQSLVCEILISSSAAAAAATATASHTRTHTQTHMHTLYTYTDSDHELEKKQIHAWPARPVYIVFFDTGQNWTQQNRREQKENSIAVEENNRE